MREGRVVLDRAMTERELQDAVTALATTLGWTVYHTAFSIRSQPGYPDLTLTRRGRLIFAELKRERGAVRPAQQQWLDRLEEVAFLCEQPFGRPVQVYLWRPSDWSSGEIERVLRGEP